jgi:hypothetical protein
VALKQNFLSTGLLRFKIYAHTGTYGSTGTPTGSALATSAGTLCAPPLDDDFYVVTDVFSDAFKTTAGTAYFLQVEHTDPVNRIYLGISTTSITGVGNCAYKSTAAGAWTASTTFTMTYTLLGIPGYSNTKYNFSNVDDYTEYIGSGGATSSNNVQSFGVLFTAPGSGIINSFYINLNISFSIGALTAKLYAVSASLPTGSALVSSDPYQLDRTGLPYNSTTIIPFIFSTSYNMTASTTYAMVIEYSGGVVSTDVSAAIGMDSSSSTYSLSTFRKLVSGSTFSTYPSTRDLPFYLFYTPLTEAAFLTYDATANGDQYNYIAATQNTKMAQSFTGIAGAFSKVTFTLKASGSPTGNITASLFADDGGTFGTTGKPTGTALATSGTISASTINTGVDTPYTFTFSTPYAMTAGTVYWVAIEYSSGSSSNKIGVVVDISSPTAPGRCAYYNGTTWAFTTYDSVGTSGASDDMCYVMYALS